MRHAESTPLWQGTALAVAIAGCIVMSLPNRQTSALNVDAMYEPVITRSGCREMDSRGRKLLGAFLAPDGRQYRCVYAPRKARRVAT